MRNVYLNMDIWDPRITQILIDLKKRLKTTMSLDEFKEVVLEIMNIDNGQIDESDEDIVCDIYDKTLYKKFGKYINHFENDVTPTFGGYGTFGEKMHQIKYSRL